MLPLRLSQLFQSLGVGSNVFAPHSRFSEGAPWGASTSEIIEKRGKGSISRKVSRPSYGTPDRQVPLEGFQNMLLCPFSE